MAKYLEIHERIGELLHVRIFSIMLFHLGKKLTEISMADQQFQQTVLHRILRKPKLNLQIAEKPGDYEACLELVLNSNLVNLNRLINKQAFSIIAYVQHRSPAIH